MIKPTRQIFSVSDITPASYNPRKISKKQKDGLSKSLDRFGYLQDIIVNIRGGLNVIVGGHKRLEALGLPAGEEIECTVVDLSPIEEKALNVALNNRHTGGDYDQDGLEKILLELKEEWAEFDELNFDDLAVEFDFDLTGDDEPPGDGDKMPEEPETVVIKRGDLIELGGHRVLCGSSTESEDMQTLIAGDKIDLVFSDPPYGIDVVNDNGKVGGGTKEYPTTKFNKIIGDTTTETAKDFYKICLSFGWDKFILWGGNYFTDFLIPNRCWLVWFKNHVTERTFANCELAWTNIDHNSKTYSVTWDGYTKEGESGAKVHPSQKPIKLCVDVLNDFTESKNIIYDGFLGSGSTLIACEKVGRTCYGMELDPYYVQIDIQRWCDYTGRDDIKINGEAVSWAEYSAVAA